jgi:uncharacterized protein (DUF1800 family)
MNAITCISTWVMQNKQLIDPCRLLLLGVLFVAPPAQAAPLEESRLILQTLNRLSLGSQPEQVAHIRTQGVASYIEEQLYPERISENADLTRQLEALETLRLPPQTLYAQYLFVDGADKAQRQRVAHGFNQVLAEAQAARLLRAVESKRQLLEVMVEFWFNHFNVFANKGGRVKLAVGDYEERVIRPLALGKFEDLLKATARHPAMLVYLDNWLNTAPHPGKHKGRYRGLNENYARELLELHTLGVDGGYTQQDVIELARILTGWGLCEGPLRKNAPASGFCFDPKRHDTGDKTLLGQTFRGGGQDEVESVLGFLARHPSTARHISFKLAQAFVADQPPEALIEQLSQTFQQSGGDIRTVLKTLFASPAFRDEAAYQAKFKSPYRYVVSVARISGGSVKNPRPLLNALRFMNMPLYQCQTPDGYKNTRTAWLSANALLQRIDFATRVGQNGYNPALPERVPVSVLRARFGDLLTARTRGELSGLNPALETAALLASPEFMSY